jgi:hypothetical protein
MRDPEEAYLRSGRAARTAISGDGWIASAFFWSGAPSWCKNIKFGIGCFDLLSVPSHDKHRGLALDRNGLSAAKPYLGSKGRKRLRISGASQ